METNLANLTPDVRHLNDLTSVMADKEFSKQFENANAYLMYRGLEEKEGIRYDITVVPARMMGSEFIKTKGHYHMGNYGEIYTVLEGEALYLMQKRKTGTENEIEDVYAVSAKPGDIVIIPSNYGHITINPSTTQDLKMANWVSSKCMSDYSLFEKYQGGSYYYLAPGTWEKNPNYNSVPELRFESPVSKLPDDLQFLNIG